MTSEYLIEIVLFEREIRTAKLAQCSAKCNTKQNEENTSKNSCSLHYKNKLRSNILSAFVKHINRKDIFGSTS